jgi:fatty acid desaturase
MNNSKGLGLVSVLTIVFVVLKLVGVINWSWFWVLSPIWIDILIFVVIFCVLYAWSEHEDSKGKCDKWKF